VLPIEESEVEGRQMSHCNDECPRCGYARGAHGMISTVCPDGHGLFMALSDIANANWRGWSHPYNTLEEFESWVKNVARTAIAKVGAA
jgi:hypothetical protein